MTPTVRIPVFARDGSIRARVLIDAADATDLWPHRWHLDSHGYAYRHDWHGNVDRPVRLHRALMGLANGDPRQVDHINGDPLDNRRANLRISTIGLNMQNRVHKEAGSSRYRGVTRYRNGKWMAQCQIAGKTHYLGYFTDEDEAGRVAAAFRAAHMPFSAEAAAYVVDSE